MIGKPPHKFGCCICCKNLVNSHLDRTTRALLSQFATEPLTTRKHHAAIMQRLDLQEDLLHQATKSEYPNEGEIFSPKSAGFLVGDFVCKNSSHDLELSHGHHEDMTDSNP